jgi:hypothetical protein
MSDSPQSRNWYHQPRWLLVGSIIGNLFGWLIVNWDKAEAHLPRMWNFAAQLLRVPAPAPQVVVEAPKVTPLPPPKPTVAPLKTSDEMTDQLRALGGDKWSGNFNAHFKNRETAMVLVLTEVVDLRFKFTGERQPTYWVTPRNRADLKKFKPGARLLIEGDLEKYTDTPSGQPDEVTIIRARVTEAKESDGIVTGSVKR